MVTKLFDTKAIGRVWLRLGVNVNVSKPKFSIRIIEIKSNWIECFVSIIDSSLTASIVYRKVENSIHNRASELRIFSMIRLTDKASECDFAFVACSDFKAFTQSLWVIWLSECHIITCVLIRSNEERIYPELILTVHQSCNKRQARLVSGWSLAVNQTQCLYRKRDRWAIAVKHTIVWHTIVCWFFNLEFVLLVYE